MHTLSFHQLPDDVLIEIAMTLSAPDLQNLALTCSSLYEICHNKSVWLHVLHRDVYSQNLPTPYYSRPLDSLSGRECAALAVHAAKLQKGLSVASNTKLGLVQVHLHGPRSVTWVRLVLGQWLLVASSDQAVSVISLWNMSAFLSAQAGQRAPVCESFLEGPVKSGLVDIQDGEIVVALEIRFELSVTALLLKIAFNGNRKVVFTRLATYAGISWLRTLRGPWIGFAVDGESSIPGVLNWRSGEITYLADLPNLKGGTLAMDINGGLLATLSPDRVDVFSLAEGGAPGCNMMRYLRSIPLAVSVGSADIKIIGPPPGHPDAPWELRFAVAGHDGIFLYGIPVGHADGRPNIEGEVVQLWSRAVPSAGQPDTTTLPYLPGTTLPYRPTIDTSGALSWLECPVLVFQQNPLPITFCTLSSCPPIPPCTSGADVTAEPSLADVYTLDHPELPALYAMGVYDYDAGLGFGIFGNYYGELTFFDLSGPGTSLASLQRTFPSCSAKIVSPEYILPESPIAATFGLPLPYMKSHETIPDAVRDRFFAYWQSSPSFPRELPPDWHIEAIDELGPDFWMPYIPRLPPAISNMAWQLEHVCHFYGATIPLMRCSWLGLEIFQAGGLLFFMSDEFLNDCCVASPGLSPGELATGLAGPIENMPLHEKLHEDAAALTWASNVARMPSLERDSGRNRWEEMQQRGGDVDPLRVLIK